ncbi:hypothetical protein Poly51_21280 [Rubripirellula tenax]|uniref:Uncharacterized protein n=1 Tax=Rubripirellula tenax TaxID=2528015 RepID=A0A5C6FFN0_9BACT|nr:hypothetical protein Poly51_21280 [Rubripirellula tenax]
MTFGVLLSVPLRFAFAMVDIAGLSINSWWPFKEILLPKIKLNCRSGFQLFPRIGNGAR